jgi:hypothetical protein
MSRFSLLSSLLLVLAAPAFAKPSPVPCSDLWSAVTETLGNPGNYAILSISEKQMKASFIVIGALYPANNYVSLKPKQGGGCDLQVRMGFTGLDDGFALRRRVNRALTKQKAAKPSPPVVSIEAGK